METILNLVRNCAKIEGKIVINGSTIEIDQRVSNNCNHASNGGDYNFWMDISVTKSGTVKFMERSSCELPMDLHHWSDSIEGIESFDDLVELVNNLAVNYDCQIVDNR